MPSRKRRSNATRRRRVPATARVLTGGSGLAVVGTLLSGSVAHASTDVTVQTLAGGQDVFAANTLYGSRETLADAIAYTNAHGGGTIGFASSLSGTIDLQEPLFIKQPTHIYDTHSPNRITIDGSTIPGHPSIFTFEAAAGPRPGTELQNLTLTGGGGAGVPFGGAVYAGTGYAILDHVVIEHSTARAGGAVADRYGTLRVRYSTLSDNSSTAGGGGAIFMQGGGQLTVDRSTLSGNAASGKGGGLAVYQGSSGTPPTLQLANSTIYQNSASYGGAFFFGPNQGTSGSPYVKAVADTIVGNSAAQVGGAAVYAAPAALISTILAGNHATGSIPLATDLCLRQGASAYIFASLLGDATDTCATVTTTDSITGRSPELSPLANNGGPTETLLPEPGSPVIDQGKVTGGPFTLSSDQRGDHRTVALAGYPAPSWGDGSDIGAVEVQSLSVLQATATGLSPEFGPSGQVVTIHGTNLLNARSVTFAGHAATILSDAQTEIRVQAPAGVSGAVEVEVTGPDGTVYAVPGRFGYLQTTTRRLDDQLVTITTVPPDLALPRAGTVPLTFSSAPIRGSHAPRLRFARAQLFYDGGIRRVIHRIRRVHGHRRRVKVVVHLPDTTLRRARDTIELPLARLHPGINTIGATVFYTERLKHPHGHHRTKQIRTRVTIRIEVV